MADPTRVVLVVEDEEAIREFLSDFLVGHGFSAVGAGTGRDALDWLRSVDRLPCVILLDYSMPEMNGEDFYTELRLDPRLARVPVVIMSARECLIDNVELLLKPFTLDQMLEVVERYRSQTRSGGSC